MSSSAKVSSESTGSRSAALETAPPELAWSVNGAKVLCAKKIQRRPVGIVRWYARRGGKNNYRTGEGERA